MKKVTLLLTLLLTSQATILFSMENTNPSRSWLSLITFGLFGTVTPAATQAAVAHEDEHLSDEETLQDAASHAAFTTDEDVQEENSDAREDVQSILPQILLPMQINQEENVQFSLIPVSHHPAAVRSRKRQRHSKQREQNRLKNLHLKRQMKNLCFKKQRRQRKLRIKSANRGE